MNDVNVNAAVSAPILSDAICGVYKDFDSQLDIPVIAGTRIVKCLYKAVGQKKAKQSQFVRIPSDHISEETILDNVEELLPFFVSFLQETEDRMIKADHAAGITNVYVDGLNIAKVIAKLEEEEAGSRLTKEIIEAWFLESVRNELRDKFAAKLGLDLSLPVEELDSGTLAKLDSIIEAYKKKFSSLAGGKTSLHEEDCLALIKVIDSVSVSKLGAKFKIKLNKMMLKDDDLLLAL